MGIATSTPASGKHGGLLVADILREQGVTHLFVLSGGHIGPLYVGAEQSGIKVVDVRHEASAVFAADAQARLTGIPGVAAVTAGPGVTNALTALKNAQLAQSPLILFGGATATLLKGRGALQDIDQISIVRSAVKAVFQPRRLRDLGPAVREAFRMAVSGVPGPVFIEVPVDLIYPESIVREWYGAKSGGGKGWMARLTQAYIRWHVDRLFSGSAAPKPVGSAGQARSEPVPGSGLRTVSRLLSGSARPVLVMGSGAMDQPRRVDELANAVAGLGIPIWLSGMARGLLGAGHPSQFIHERKKALREADLILLAGVPADFRLDYGRHLNRNARVVSLHLDQVSLRKNLPRTTTRIRTDPGEFLIRLADHRPDSGMSPEWPKILAGHDADREAEIRALAGESLDGINPIALFQALKEDLPPGAVLVADGGDFAATAAYVLRPDGPLRWLDPGVFGTLGVGGGFALGAGMSDPDATIWIVYGDGSAAYSLAEFDIFAKHRMKVCAIVGNNASWAQIARDQVSMLGASTAVDLRHSDYHLVARAYGAEGERVDTLDGFRAAVARAKENLIAGRPVLINAIIGTSSFRKGSISM